MTAAELAAAWSKVERAVEEHARFPPGAFAVSCWETVARGDVATVKRADGAVGVGVLDSSRAAAWLSLTDDAPMERVEGLVEVRLAGRWSGDKVLYQLLDLPWPVTDRHWVLETRTNLALAAAADVWERAWTLNPGRLAEGRAHVGGERFDAAAPVRRNDGAWLLVTLDATHTLGVYQARVDLGGNLPEDATRAYASATMAENFEKVERNARDLARRYGPGCSPQPGGDGAPIPCF